ncbi:MAG: glutamine--fructose-6-phosphate transaminase (isomerizing) [Candidatus Yanofskybacteria bacterium]|nr:glutamine--fructose-6-phosphate transaminase (isomerizing) [Candidatus Yanofskybacteria bacterium]
MCGIIGYVGKQNATPLLLEGLRRESYRGYDSSGITVFGKTTVYHERAVGKLAVLEEKIEGKLIEGGVGIGHCLSPNTLVQLADGRVKPISRITGEDHVCALNSVTLSQDSGQVRAWKHVSPKHIYELRTPSTVIEATGKHKMFVWTEEGLVEKAVQDIVPGDVLLFPKRIKRLGAAKRMRFQRVAYPVYYQVAEEAYDMIRARMSSLSITNSELASQTGVYSDDIGHMINNDRNMRGDILERVLPVLSLPFPGEGFIPRHSIHGNFLTLPTKSSPEIMQIIGYFLGDGYAGIRTIRFKDPRRDVLEKYQELCERVFNLAGRIAPMNDTNAYLLEINSTPLAEWFHKNIRDRKHEILEEVGCLPKQELAAFLRGLFDAEGYVGKDAHQIGICMTDEQIVRTMHLLLLQFGILSSLTDKNTNRPAHWKRPYKLSISSQDSLRIFLTEICFTSSEKQRAAQTLVAKGALNVSTSFKALPYRKRVLWNKCAPFLSGATLRSILGHGGNLENFAFETTIKKVILALKAQNTEATKRIAQELKSFLHGEVVFQEVTSNKRKNSPYPFLYDLEITPQQNFFANGLLSHNSRWATHGGVTEENAHPHCDCKGNIFVVHNGIIENFQILKKKLEEHGHVFLSQTDTEVLAHLIEHFFKGNLENAVRSTLKLVRGSYGIAVIAKDDPEKIVAARLSSPLVLSINGSGGFVASDPSALISHSKRMVFLEDGEIGVIKHDNFFVTDLANNHLAKEVTELEWSTEEAQKGGYPHFMLKEIMEQPEAIANALRGRLLLEEGNAKLGGLAEVEDRLRTIDRVCILGCGTAVYAGRVGEYMLEEYAGISCEVDIASEFRYRKPIIKENTAFVIISQSGETADTLAALKEVKQKGGITVGIINVVGSSIARELSAGIYNHAGPEIGVASTKAFTSQLSLLALLTLFLGRQRELSLVMGQRIARELEELPNLLSRCLELATSIENIARKYQHAPNFLYIGRKYNFPLALEGALKLKEIAYVHAEGYGAGEMKHGPIALIDENFPTVAICPSDSMYEKMVSNIQEVKARKGPVIAITTEGNEEMRMLADDVIYIPKTIEMLTPILAAIPLQLFAYHMAVLKGYDPDFPRNLAKSVTVE